MLCAYVFRFWGLCTYSELQLRSSLEKAANLNTEPSTRRTNFPGFFLLASYGGTSIGQQRRKTTPHCECRRWTWSETRRRLCKCDCNCKNKNEGKDKLEIGPPLAGADHSKVDIALGRRISKHTAYCTLNKWGACDLVRSKIIKQFVDGKNEAGINSSLHYVRVRVARNAIQYYNINNYNIILAVFKYVLLHVVVI